MTAQHPEPGRFGTTESGRPLDDYADATNHYAGPFCGCGDYSCAANRDEAADCSNRQD